MPYLHLSAPWMPSLLNCKLPTNLKPQETQSMQYNIYSNTWCNCCLCIIVTINARNFAKLKLLETLQSFVLFRSQQVTVSTLQCVEEGREREREKRAKDAKQVVFCPTHHCFVRWPWVWVCERERPGNPCRNASNTFSFCSPPFLMQLLRVECFNHLFPSF